MRLELWSIYDKDRMFAMIECKLAPLPWAILLDGTRLFLRRSETSWEYHERPGGLVMLNHCKADRVETVPDWAEVIKGVLPDVFEIDDGDVLAEVPPGSNRWMEVGRGLACGLLREKA